MTCESGGGGAKRRVSQGREGLGDLMIGAGVNQFIVRRLVCRSAPMTVQLKGQVSYRGASLGYRDAQWA